MNTGIFELRPVSLSLLHQPVVRCLWDQHDGAEEQALVVSHPLGSCLRVSGPLEDFHQNCYCDTEQSRFPARLDHDVVLTSFLLSCPVTTVEERPAEASFIGSVGSGVQSIKSDVLDPGLSHHQPATSQIGLDITDVLSPGLFDC